MHGAGGQYLTHWNRSDHQHLARLIGVDADVVFRIDRGVGVVLHGRGQEQLRCARGEPCLGEMEGRRRRVEFSFQVVWYGLKISRDQVAVRI